VKDKYRTYLISAQNHARATRTVRQHGIGFSLQREFEARNQLIGYIKKDTTTVASNPLFLRLS
jgi:hypothetical protein